MPEFILNTPRNRKPPHPYYALSDFAKGYVEAMFFTNGDTGDDRENLLNDWGVECLTHEACERIARDCLQFWNRNETNIQAALALEPGDTDFLYATEPLDDVRIGHLFWYARQGHGAAFDDNGDAPCLKALQSAAQFAGPAQIEAYRKKIHYS